MFPLMPRILMSAEVPPRPPVKPAFLDMGDIVRHQVIAERVALVHRAPQLPCLWIDEDSSAGIANPGGIYAQCAVRRIAHLNVGPISLLGVRIGIIHVGCRTHSDEKLLAVLRKLHGTSPMPATTRQIRHMLG